MKQILARSEKASLPHFPPPSQMGSLAASAARFPWMKSGLSTASISFWAKDYCNADAIRQIVNYALLDFARRKKKGKSSQARITAKSVMPPGTFPIEAANHFTSRSLFAPHMPDFATMSPTHSREIFTFFPGTKTSALFMHFT